MEYITKDSKSMFYLFDPMMDPNPLREKNILRFFMYEGKIQSCIHTFYSPKNTQHFDSLVCINKVEAKYGIIH
jgi:hypothetical protein